ncbi:MAG TPA: hypothetical protein PKD85_08615, partial [Saprospiraceae bacterium]|nr:hypothetical protein [Saprospiraceae bacterium]
MTKIFLISLTWVFITPLWSQQSISMADTLYSEYIGHKTIKQIVPNKKDTIIQYTFQSKPLHTIDNGIFQLKDLKINGDFINNRPNGNWNFSFKTTNIEETSLSNQKKISLNYKINGNDVKFTFPFSNGNLKGTTLGKNIPITNGILGKES